MPYRVSAELHPMEYFSRLNIDFDDLEEDSDPQDDEPSTESTSAPSSLSSSSSSSPSPSSHSGEEEKISTPDNSNHSIGTPETSDDDEDSVDLDDLFNDNGLVHEHQDEEVHNRNTDEPRRQSCPDPHILHKLAMRYLYESDDSKLSVSDSALVVEKELALLLFHVDLEDSRGRLSYAANTYANAAA